MSSAHMDGVYIQRNPISLPVCISKKDESVENSTTVTFCIVRHVMQQPSNPTEAPSIEDQVDIDWDC